MTDKRMPIDDLQEIARQKTRAALAGWKIPEEHEPNLTLGVDVNEPDHMTFTLYIAGERPTDAICLTSARLDRRTGEGAVEIFTEHLEPDE